MSTHRLYYDDSYLQNFDARILSSLPAAPFASPAGTVPAWEVILDQSAFYPTSGGQPNDLGCLGEAKVLDVREEGDEIVHILDRELTLGAVHGSLDWLRRFDHMQQHSGQHLLSAVFQERFGLATVSFHLGQQICTIDLRGPEPSPEVLEGAQRAANNVIFEDRPVRVRYGTVEQLAEIGVRKTVDRKGILRAVEIESADLQPCGGTHVKSTGPIGVILVRRCSKVRQDWRVEFVCGARAARAAAADFGLVRSMAERLTCAPDEILASLDKAARERDESFKQLRDALLQLAELRAAEFLALAQPVAPELLLVSRQLPGTQLEFLQMIVSEIARRGQNIALLAMPETGQIIFHQHPRSERDFSAMLKELLVRFPGKGGGTRNFVRAKLSDPADTGPLLAAATAMVTGESSNAVGI